MNTKTDRHMIHTHGMIRALLLASTVFLLASTLQGYVFKNNYISFGSIVGAPEEIYSLLVKQDAEGLDLTMVSLRLGDAGMIYVPEWTTMDDGADLYFASYGDVFSNDTIGAGNFTIFNTPVTSGLEYPVVPGLFYMGVNTGSVRDVFGWALFNYTGTSIELVDSLMVFGAEGIVIGEAMAVVPEAGNVGVCLGLVAILCVMRRKWLCQRL